MRYLTALLIPLFLVLGSLSRQVASAEKVSVVGYGETEQKAKDDAFRAALQRVIGSMLSAKTQSDKAGMLYERIISKTDGFIKKPEWGDVKKMANGFFAAPLECLVDSGKIGEDLSAILQYRNPKIIILPTDLSVWKNKASKGNIKSVINGFENYLAKRKFRILDADNALVEAIKTAGSRQKVIQKLRIADYVIFIDASSAKRPKSRGGHFNAIAVVNAYIVNTSTSREVANATSLDAKGNSAKTGHGQSRTGQTEALDMALNQAGISCMKKLKGMLIKHYLKEQSEGILYTIKFKSLTFRKRLDLRRALNTNMTITYSRAIRGAGDWQEYEIRSTSKDLEDLVDSLADTLEDEYEYKTPDDYTLIESQSGQEAIVSLKDITPPKKK